MNKVDLLFIVDVTSSMGSFISDAKQKMQSILENLKSEFKVDLQVGLSLYRDHPSQDTSFVTAVCDLMEVDKIQEKISKIGVYGGGDFPEAVFDGIIDGVSSMSWRDGSRRIAFLIGDAPPQGMNESNQKCCLCGKTWGDAVCAAQEKDVVIYSIALDYHDITKESFKIISNFTGGLLVEGSNAMDIILETLKSEFDNMNLDSQILEMMSKDYDIGQICEMLNLDREKISESKSRLAQFI